MKKLIFILFVLIFLETTFIHYPLTLAMIILISIFTDADVAAAAFAAGLLLDFFSLHLIGISSLYFLCLIYVGNRYRKKIYGGSFIYRFLYLVLSYILYSLLFYRTVYILQAMVTLAVGPVIILVADRLFPQTGSRKRLAV